MLNKNQSLLRTLLFPLITLVTVVFVFVMYRPSQASPDGTYVVNTTTDTDDGACDAAHCSLREAVNAANNAAGPETISFALPADSIIHLIGPQQLTITDTLTIDGSGVVSLNIHGGVSSTFRIGSGTAVTITTLTFSYSGAASGGSLYNDGGLLNVNHSTFFRNNSLDLSTGGGAIANWEGTLNVSDSFFYSNYAANMGGAILNYQGTANISRSTFWDNRANWDPAGGYHRVGGAVANQQGTLNISNSTFDSNSCFGFPEPCFGGGVSSNGILNLINSTFSGNAATAYPSKGGGIYNYEGGILNLRNTIIANSDSGGDCVSGAISVNINNLIEDGSCSPAFSGDPLLGPMQDNGGSTWTMAPSSISQAVDHGDNGTCAAPPVNNLDQRGVTRPLDGDGEGTPICDIGAYEYDGSPPDRSFLPIFLRN